MKAQEPEVGMGVTELGWSDAYPWEIIKVISSRKIILRRMKAERDPAWKPEMIAGGLSNNINRIAVFNICYLLKFNHTFNPAAYQYSFIRIKLDANLSHSAVFQIIGSV